MEYFINALLKDVGRTSVFTPVSQPFSHEELPKMIKVFYYQLMHKRNVLKMSIRIYIKISATCFGVITIIREPNVCAC